MTLNLLSVESRPDLTAPSVYRALRNATSYSNDIFVVEIDPLFKGGDEFCSKYGVDPANGANCVVLEARRSDKIYYVATLVAVGSRMDIGGEVRRAVNARKLSVAPLQDVLAKTGMEYGSITVIGLPDDWPILVDDRIVAKDFLFIGSGKVNSKLRIPGAYFVGDDRFTIFPGLGIPKK